MVGEYIAAAAGARLRALAPPAAVQTAVVSLGVEDDASFAALGAAQALQCLEPYRTVLAVELVAAVRALRMRQRPVPEAVAGFRVDVQDRDLTDDIALAEALLPSLEVELTDGSA
jgi:histidine ammonia-lyase